MRHLTPHLSPYNTNTAALTTTFLFLLVPILGKQVGSSISLTDNLDPAVLRVTCIAQPYNPAGKI